jgi:hypothetical protein
VLDPIRCRAEGVKAEAEYDDQHKDGPSPDKYEAARLQYGTARHDATTTVAEVRNQLMHVTDQLKCIIDDNEIVERLDHAWLDVKRRLEVCDPQLGCCVDDNDDFDTDVDDYGTEIVRARAAEYDHRTQAAEDCFAKLLGEPERLTDRVTKLQAEVAGIASDVGVDTATTDFKKLYARALVAWRHLDEVWWGFDHAHDYVDCLCAALQISLRGRAALSKLTGVLKVRECIHQARDARCKHLRDHMVDGIIEEYVRRSLPRHPHDDDRERRRRPEGGREDRDREGDRDRDRDRAHDRDRDRDNWGRDRDRKRDRDRGPYRDRDHDRDKDRNHDRGRDRKHDHDRDREHNRDRDREHNRDRDRDRERDRDRDRDWDDD